MTTTAIQMVTRGTVTADDGSYVVKTQVWRAVELCANTWAIVDESGNRYGQDGGRWTGFESRYWTEQNMRKIAKRWGYKIEAATN